MIALLEMDMEEMERMLPEEATAVGRVVTYSRKVFIPLTRLCRDRCAYCTFASHEGLAHPSHQGPPAAFLSVEEVLEADECFCCGTAVVVVPVGSITVKGEKTQFQGGKTGPVAQEMYDELTGIQSGKVEGPDGWLEVVPEEYHL